MNIRQTAIPRRVLSLALCAAMVLTLLPLPTPAEGICGHHPEHTADCGYQAAVEGQDCTHSHDDSCGYQEASPCAHSHDASCGYREASNCTHQHTEECGENGESCTHSHDGSCGYQEAENCTHSHDDACGYREARTCTHVHNDTCGYVEAVAGSPCTYRCEICAQQQNGQDLCAHGNDLNACEACASDAQVASVQKLIDALPETVTEENREAAQSALSAVDTAKSALTEAEQEKLNLTRYTALKALLAEPEAPDTGKVITDWTWVDPDEWLEEDGSFIMPGVTEDSPAYFEDVVEYLPTQITALIDGVEVTLDLGDWSCDDYPMETGTSQGEFVFTATLPEGYVLADGSNTLRLPVTVAPMDLSDGEDVSGYNSGGNGQNEQWDDVKSNGVRNWNKDTLAFETGVGNLMHYREITKKYNCNVEWTKYAYLWKTNENTEGVTVYPGYCVHSQTAEITGTLTIKDDINLILCAEQTNADELPDMVLTVGSINIDSGKTLTIWTKNGGWQGGKLIVKGDISGGGTLVVRDGYVEAQNITCKFSTGGSGNGKESLGVVKANSISDQSGKANWGGVIVENGVGRACGTAAQELIYDLQCDTLTIDSGKTLTVGWDGYKNPEGTNIGARHNVKLIADNLVNNGTLINKAKLYYNTLSGSGETAATNGRYGYYKNENGQKVYRSFTLVTSDITELTNTAKTNDGWYLVSGNVEWANRVAVAANTTVNLVLADGCTLTAKEGITVGGAGGPTLIIWCQEAGTGTLNAQTSNNQCAAIGMNGDGTSTGVITIHGGNIDAEYTGSDRLNSKNCGLGGQNGSAVCTVTINGGTITTPALVSDNLTINGGTITVLNRISGRFLAPATDGGSTFVTADENWASGEVNRRGLFFFGDTGKVCTGSGTELTLARAMEVPAGKTLVIPQDKTLNAGNYLTNSGAVCVGGAYTGSLSGDIYYRLSVEGGTAASAGNIKPIDDVTYVKAGSTVTLTPGAAPTGKRFDHWNPPADLTLNNSNTFTMPANTVDISAEYSDAVVITQQPEVQEITYGGIATLSVTAQNPSGDTEGITYQWYQVINNKEEKLSGETNELLELTTLNAGTYSYFCRVTWNGISIDSSQATVKVNQATGSVTFTNTSLDKTYNGQSVVLTKDTDYTVTGDGAVTVEYTKQGETNYSTTAPTNAGKYTVRVTLAAGTNYTGDSESKDFTISKAYNTWTKEPSVKNPAYYGDTDLVTYQAKYGNENVNVRYLGENDQPVNSVNAGDYDVIVSLSEVDNYTGLSMVKMPLTILPRPIDETDISVEPGTFEYGGTTKTPTVTIQYKGKTLVEGKDYELTGATSGTDPDTYTLTITGRGNFSETTTKTWNITKASITPVVSLGDTVYGDPLSPSVSGNSGNGEVTYTYYSDETCTNAVTPRNAGTYYVKAAVAETANYQSGESAPVPFRITQKPVIVSGITAGDKTYDGNTTATLNYDGVTFTGKLEGDSLTVTAIGTFENANAAENKTVNIRDLTLGGDSKDNYVLAADDQQTAATAAITKANASVTKAPEDAKSLYSGLDVPLVTEGTAQGGTMMYRLGEDGSWTELLPQAAAHGEYTVYYYVKGDGNHEDTAQQSLKARILPFEITAQPQAKSMDYGESTALSVTLNPKAADVSGITYQWCLVTVEDSKEIYTPLEGETRSELTLTKPNAGEYTYVCIVTCGDYSETSSKATVTVTAVPQDLPTTDLPDGLWVEGGEKPLVDNSIDLKSPSSFLMTSYTYNGASADAHQNYPTGMQVYSVQEDDQGKTTVAPVAELGNLLRYSGCSIRITGKPGIRMITSLTKEAKAALKKGELAGYTLEEYGTVAIWKTNLKDQPLTLETEKANHKYAYKRGVSDPVFANVGNLTQYTNVLVWDTLDAEKYAEDIVMRPYIKLSNQAGETVTLYGGTVSRSIGYVAQQNANTFSKGTAGYKYVHEIIDKVNALHSSTGTNTTTGGNG